MGHCGGPLGEGERVVVVVGWQDDEIAQGRGFGPAKPKTERNALCIAWPSKLHGRGCRGCILVSIDIWVEVVGGRDAEIAWGWWFRTQKDGY